MRWAPGQENGDCLARTPAGFDLRGEGEGRSGPNTEAPGGSGGDRAHSPHAVLDVVARGVLATWHKMEAESEPNRGKKALVVGEAKAMERTGGGARGPPFSLFHFSPDADSHECTEDGSVLSLTEAKAA
ncbi:hypothetical protein NDU88_002452 [Pleurodeles waltl]|uniref:Uncharacterized protein n=1 Tax=Pleurodeles waltl TaxID=8319 RepID=A0AAV7SCH7_PLEWA|nr:hypothetical protein NDU88_002452 [Pleurodeles waltl]